MRRVRRRLYSDSDLVVTSFHRVILLNGIEFGDVRGDLADRTLFLELPAITADRRRAESELEDLFLRSHPAILGGLLDLAVKGLSGLPDVHLTTMPRMGDFARILAAVDGVTGWQTLPMFEASQADQQHEVLEADEVATAVVTLMDAVAGEWTGTATELLEKLSTEDRSKTWPKTASHLSGRLKRAVPALVGVGISIDWVRGSDQKRSRLIVIEMRGNDRPERPGRPNLDSADGVDGEIPNSLFRPNSDE